MKWKFAGTERLTMRSRLNVAHRSTKDQTPPVLLLAANTTTLRCCLTWRRKAKRKLCVKWGKRRRKAAAAAILGTKRREKWTHARKVLRRRRCNKQKRRPATTKHLADGPQTEEMFSYFLNFQRIASWFVLWPPPPPNKRCCFIRRQGNHFTLSFSHLSVVGQCQPFSAPIPSTFSTWNKPLAPTMEAHHDGYTQATCCTSVNRRNDGRKKRHTLARWLAGATYHQPATPFLRPLAASSWKKIKEEQLIRTCNFIGVSPGAGIISTGPVLCAIFHTNKRISLAAWLRPLFSLSLSLSLIPCVCCTFYCFASIVLNRTGDGFCLGHWSVTLETLMNPHLSDVDVTASRHSFRSHETRSPSKLTRIIV